ncbi:MAG TPA: heme lyase CcmF/NrfE family subunit [Actinomycetota bacterium]|nr:heme lyase CcmF/NrfE family subunit [Actinomycetota bacterium]
MDAGLLGRLLLYAAVATSLWGLVASEVGRRRKDPRLVLTGRRALYVTCAIFVVAAVILVGAIMRHDFAIEYVAQVSSRTLRFPYTVSALWAGMAGSLLFWSLLTSLYASTAIAVQAPRRPELVPTATAVLSFILGFLAVVLAFGANPFAGSPTVPPDGQGLNPLLQSGFMNIHPVMLYAGLTGFAVPFAFAVSALVSGKLDSSWFTSTRRWTMLAWTFLTVGIILGAAWAYMELGWGGYWAWDPVENASLLPWLTGTAFLHSVMIQERRGMLKTWNVALVLSTYSLAVLGTFLTRSGLLASVHTFSNSPVGKFFLPFLAVLVVASFLLLAMRLDKLRSDRHLDSALSRESMFLFNNLLFAAIAFTVLWGTLYPVFVEAFKGQQIAVGPPFFDAVVVPLGLALLALMGIGPLVAWRRASAVSIRRAFALPFAAGALVILLLYARGVRSAGAAFAIGLGAFVTVTIATEFIKGARAHARTELLPLPRALVRTLTRNRRRYGGYIVHFGVVLIFLGLAGASFVKTWSGGLSPGQSFTIGAYTVHYVDVQTGSKPGELLSDAVMDISRGGHRIAVMRPSINFYTAQQENQPTVALRSTPAEDLYLALNDLDPTTGAIVLRAWVNPLVMWIWIGGVVMALGMVLILTGRPPGSPAPPAPGRSEEVPAADEGPEKVAVPA